MKTLRKLIVHNTRVKQRVDPPFVLIIVKPRPPHRVNLLFISRAPTFLWEHRIRGNGWDAPPDTYSYDAPREYNIIQNKPSYSRPRAPFREQHVFPRASAERYNVPPPEFVVPRRIQPYPVEECSVRALEVHEVRPAQDLRR